MKRIYSMKHHILQLLALAGGAFRNMGRDDVSIGGNRGSIVPGRVTAPTGPWHKPGNAGAYGMAILGNPKYRAWKRKHNRRVRNANGGK